MKFLAKSDNMGALTDTFPARTSAMALPRFDDPILGVFKEMLPYGRPVPAHPDWVQISQAYFDGIQRILLGDEDPQTAMDGAAEEIQALLDDSTAPAPAAGHPPGIAPCQPVDRTLLRRCRR